MRPDFLRVLVLSSACVLSACPAPAPSGPDAGTPPPDAGTGSSGEVAPSSRNNLRFKNPEQLTAHFASALSLPPEQVCNELGQYPCTTYVHTVALGGVEPYGVGLYEPLTSSGVTTPIVIDRVALAACVRRVSLDIATPGETSVFKGIELDAQGRLANREGAPVRDAITSLYQRALLRDPTDTEVGTLSQLATELESKGTQTPGRDWMIASCFVVLSSAESVFF
ncbi:hypothetical protein [Cystobacter ferrugineus]|uniref:DUF1595 domain-containing protein n=1 Tax=Cystobacter ferrugineus TaxID=83449 RepID=A0A1L9BA44_9BACT|nr:hypothetical protein [Cystobacter ferrugineus]OJH39109.1 hypothetical protein BON30_16295 [Cystobacter ferrugineus]